MCTSCSLGYYLYEGFCVDTCPPSSTLTSAICIDFSTTLTSKIIAKLFVRSELFVCFIDPGYLIKNGLTSSTFGESEIKSYGITVTGFKGFNG
jgi:proprotein convertase subtilisin/kexin type 5